MRAIWSFWTKPHRSFSGWQWLTNRHQLFSWILSVKAAARHFEETALFTDDEGARLLVDRLQLPFTEVSTALNDLQDQDPDWWMLGKLYTYHLQRAAFVHIDYDVYLWKALPGRLTSAAVLAQNPEDPREHSGYDAEACESVIRSLGDGWIPPEWSWYRAQKSIQQAANCGIVGGNRSEFLSEYAEIVIRLLRNPLNRAAFNTLGNKKLFNTFFEQYLLCACAAYRGVEIEYLFESMADAVTPIRAEELGYTHLWGGAKMDRAIANRLEGRVARDFPECFDRCNHMVAGSEFALGI